MLITEFNEEATLQYLRDEAHSIGLEEGLQLGRDEGIKLGRDEGLKIGRDEGLKLGRDEGMKLGRDEGFQDGRDEGLKLSNQQHLERVAALVRSGDLTLAQAQLLGFSQEELEATN